MSSLRINPATIQRAPTTIGIIDGGNMGELIRSFDWTQTSLGEISQWPQSLKTAVNIMLQSPVPIVMLWGTDGVMLYNDAYSRFAGGRHPVLLGSKVVEGWPEVADFNRNVMKQGLAGKTLSYKDQQLILHRNGVPEEVWMDLNYSPILDESGQPGGVLAIVVETTQMVMAKRATQRSEERFRAAVNAMQGILWTNSPNGTMDDPQPGWEALTGQTFEEYQGYGWSKVVHPDDIETTITAWQKSVSEKTTFNFTHRVKRYDGAWRWFSVRAVPAFNADGVVREWVGVHTDITEQYEAEQALKESQARFQQIADEAPVFIFMISADASIEFWNKTLLDAVGLSLEEVKQQSWQTLIHPDDMEATLQIFQTAVQTMQPFVIENRYRTREGEYRWVLWKGIPRYLPNGEFISFMGTGVDIHDRKMAEDALAISEARLRAIVDTTPECIKIVDPDGTLVYMNHSGLQMIEAAATDVIGNAKVFELIATDFREEWQQNHTRVCQGESLRWEFDIISLQGRLRHMETHAVPLPTPGGYAHLGVTRDVTERKRATEAVLESEVRFRTMADAAPVMIWMSDSQGACNYVNKGWLDFTGRMLEQEQGEGWTESIHPEDVQHCVMFYKQAFAKREEFEMEYRLRRQDGRYRWVLDHGIPRFEPDGSFAGYIGSCLDIHDRKQAEESLQNYAKRLERSNKELQQFATIASHDLQEPLRKIQVFSGMLEARVPEDGKEYLQRIGAAANRMSVLMDDLLTLSRINRKKSEFKIVALNGMLQTVLDAMKVLISSSQANITIEDLGCMYGDESQIRQLFQNLINNAIKYRRPDVVPVIHISGRPYRYGIEITVSDNGIGILEEHFERIFEPFQRLHGVGKYPGTGMGLAIVKKIVERHGGTISLESRMNEGTRFRFTLPTVPF